MHWEEFQKCVKEKLGRTDFYKSRNGVANPPLPVV